ncbi:glycerol dehydratase reactivase beta/small subunit family protein [Proteiniclasticum sp. C24MP]|uniref:glycerol dehydratase reactivase beta/small subunit family protein n=1 Tax=Proteiniclasticum sp. C24MP TaxID=3374101 RepID=UPI003754F189
MDETGNICVVLCVNEDVKGRAEIREITYGIEEEGIPYIIRISEEKRLEELARIASMDSQLDVGIGVDESLSGAIYYDKLPEDYLLFRGNLLKETMKCRNLGINAARLVKGIPFNMGGA